MCECRPIQTTPSNLRIPTTSKRTLRTAVHSSSDRSPIRVPTGAAQPASSQAPTGTGSGPAGWERTAVGSGGSICKFQRVLKEKAFAAEIKGQEVFFDAKYKMR